ncbi:hypothetical protein F53441_3690 [Fusarium austroafricanum]|uniref:CBM-cenC domain-containing protein n=1 Tax=Fusarium austroafricanum TaxID=2364996 RepID=A0A8H4KNM4_9HYPO|nr:hypothetical protein F53441_3690 [Fusarium austroafricanum]
MKFSQSVLQLLALCQLAAASPCKPSSSGSSIIPTTTETKSSTSVETGSSTAVTLSETESASDSTTLVSSAEPTTTPEATTDLTTLLGETTTTEVSTSGAEPTTTLEATATTLSEEPTTTFVSTTVEPTTTTAEASTTTTSLPQGPPNLAVNGGFEDGTVSPWEKVSPQGTLSAITLSTHSGNQAGYFTGRAPSSVPSTLGIKQTISASTLEAGKSYKLSAWYILSQSDCFGPHLLCGYGWQTLWPPTKLTLVTGYSQAEVTCSWTQEQLNAGPNIQIQGDCFNLDIIIDDVVLEEVV